MNISVIIPAYNAEKSIADCINSVLNQKFRKSSGKYEIIVVDDGSSDKTAEVVSKFVGTDAKFAGVKK